MIIEVITRYLANLDHLCAGRNVILHAVAADRSQIRIGRATGSPPDVSPAGLKTVSER